MSFNFVNSRIEDGLYEPEAVYLSAPFEGRRRVIQGWGVRPEHYGRFAQGEKTLLGHEGIDFEVRPSERIVAVDGGAITTVANDQQRFGNFVRITHWWGESFYTRFQEVTVNTGQRVERGDLLGYFRQDPDPEMLFHFGIRITPFAEDDGWSGYVNPLPHLPPLSILPE